MDEAVQSSKKAITSLVLGITSIFCLCFFITGIPAIIFGLLALSDISRSPTRLKGRGMAITGIALGAFGSTIVTLISIALLLPAVQMARQAARRVESMNNMKQIGLAVQKVATKDGAIPAQYTLDSAGQPGASWRVQTLPYLEGAEQSFQLYHLDEPWNSPGNLQALAVIPRQFVNPMDDSAAEQGGKNVGYVAVAGPGFLFDGPTPHKLNEIRDGFSQTIMAVEVTQSGIALAEPRDLTWDEFLAKFKARKVGRDFWVNVVFADGAVRQIPYDTPPETLRAYFTIDGGENVPLP